MTRATLLLTSLALFACSTGDDPGDSSSDSGVTTATAGTDPSTTDPAKGACSDSITGCARASSDRRSAW